MRSSFPTCELFGSDAFCCLYYHYHFHQYLHLLVLLPVEGSELVVAAALQTGPLGLPGIPGSRPGVPA